MLSTWISKCGRYILYPKPYLVITMKNFNWYYQYRVPNKDDFFEYPIHRVGLAGLAGD